MHEVIQKCAELHVPLQATLEITYRCNLRCVHCYSDIRVPKSEELSFEEWRESLEQLKRAGTAFLLFTGGEIMMRDDILGIASFARSSGFIVGFYSNCTLIDSETARAMAELKPFSITTTLYGATPDTHDSVTGCPGSFDGTIEGIRHLVEAGIAPMVQILAMHSNAAELLSASEMVAALGARHRVNFAMAPSKSGHSFPFLCEATVDDLLASGWRPGSPVTGRTPKPHICRAGRTIASVAPNGEVSPCVMLPLNLGKLPERDFDTIWSHAPCAELRYLRSMGRTDLYQCIDCEFREFCERCTGIAYTESGRLDGPSESACRQAKVRMRLTQAEEVRS